MAETNPVSSNSEEAQQENNLQAVVEEEKWQIRECDLYYDEYKDCTSFKGRFQQYFVYGDTLDCNQWKKDYDNCCKWRDSEDLKAADALIKSETNRRMQRFRAHYRNDTWKKRDSPPEDWDKPLPDWLVKRDENSYLALRAKEMKEGKEEEPKKSCLIM